MVLMVMVISLYLLCRNHLPSEPQTQEASHQADPPHSLDDGAALRLPAGPLLLLRHGGPGQRQDTFLFLVLGPHLPAVVLRLQLCQAVSH